MNPIPRIRFAHLPTPIEEMPRLSAALAGPRLFVKRDDQTGLAFGGNKTRKLEFLVAEAQQQGADVLISAGAARPSMRRRRCPLSAIKHNAPLQPSADAIANANQIGNWRRSAPTMKLCDGSSGR